MDTRWWGTGFGDPILKAFLAPRLEILFVRARSLFFSISESNCRRSSLLIPGFGMESIAKNNFSTKSSFMDFGADFVSFFETLGPVVLVFSALKAGLKLMYLDRAPGSKVG